MAVQVWFSLPKRFYTEKVKVDVIFVISTKSTLKFLLKNSVAFTNVNFEWEFILLPLFIHYALCAYLSKFTFDGFCFKNF